LITTSVDKSRIVISVKDSGIGISEQEKKNLFHLSPKTKGLGLVIAD